jgi:tetratricopeptide (TPR) repeat protein
VKRSKKHIKLSQSSSGKEKKIIEWEKMAAVSALLFLMILGISSFFPKERLWGINHLSYFPLWFRALVIFLGSLAFIPLVNQNLQRFLEKSVVPGFSFLVERRKYLGYPITILLFVLFFYLFRTRTHFLGDGAQIISYINSGTLSIKWTNPLASWIYLSAYDLLNEFSHFDGAVVYALISYVCGAIFVFFALRLADLLGKTASTKLFVFSALTFMGGTQLFLGYAEHYPLFYCGILIYLFYSIKYLKGETKLLLPMLFFCMLLPIHLFSIYLFPSAIFLFLSGGGEGKAKPVLKIKRIWIVSPVLILVFACLIIYFWKYGWYSMGYLVPLFSGTYYAPGYTLFSPPHLLDFINQQFLVSPIGFLLFLIFLILRPEDLDSKDKIFRFLLAVSMAQLLFNFVLDPGLGAGRDWDLFASVGLGYTLLSLYLFGKMPPNPKINYLKLGLTMIVLISTLSWLGINASPDLSVRRFRNLLDLDPKKSLNGHHILVAYFERLGKLEEANREKQAWAQKLPEYKLLHQGMKFMKEGELENAYSSYTQALQISPNFPDGHWALGDYYLYTRNLEKAETELKKAVDLKPGFAIPYADLAVVYSLRKSMKKARIMVERAMVLGISDAEVLYDMGNVYSSLGEVDKAIAAFKKAIRVNHKFADPHLGLALAFFRQGKLEASIDEINRAIQINPDFASAYYHLGRIYGNLGMKEECVSAFEKYLELEPSSPLAKNIEKLMKRLESE